MTSLKGVAALEWFSQLELEQREFVINFLERDQLILLPLPLFAYQLPPLLDSQIRCMVVFDEVVCSAFALDAVLGSVSASLVTRYFPAKTTSSA